MTNEDFIKNKKSILEKLYKNYIDSTSDPFNRKNPDHLNIQKVFSKNKYQKILVEVSESDNDSFYFKEYGFLFTPKNNFITFCCMGNKDSDSDFILIKTFKNIKGIDFKEIIDLIIEHYKQTKKYGFDYLGLNSQFKWDIDIFSNLLQKDLEIRKEYYDNSDISNELEFKEKYKKLDKSIDPAFYSKGSMHPDIIIYSFNDNNEYKPIKKIKPKK